MYAITKRTLILLVAALFLGLGSTGVRAQDETDAKDAKARRPAPRTDVVYLLDVSGSMRKERALRRAQELLVDIADKLVHPGTKVALIPFGTGVHKPVRFDVPADRAGAQKALSAIRAAIGDVSARDSYTYLYQAIQKGLETLHEFKKANPRHGRHIILISDGKQLMRRGEQGPSLLEIVEYIEGQGFKRGEDWFIWYGHFGEPDETLKNALEELGAGKSISLDEIPTLQWGLTTLETQALSLGRRKPGAWTATAKIVARTDKNALGKTVRLKVAPGKLPEGMTLAVTPSEVKLDEKRTEIEVTIKCTGAQSGNFDAALVVDADEDSLHWVENNKVSVSFFVGTPRIDVGTPAFEIGRLAPGMSANRTVVLIPNEDAAGAKPQVSLSVSGRHASHVAVVTDVEASRRVEVPLKVTVPVDAKPGAYTCTVKVDAGDGVEVVPAEVTVSYRVGTGRITVGEDEVAFDRVLAGREATASITLTPDEETARLGTEIKAKIFLFERGGVELVVPQTIRLDGRTRVPVTVKVPLDAVAGGYQARIRFEAPEGIKIEPDTVPVSLKVIAASALSLPAVVDLGDVSASKAREIAGRLELVVGEPHDGVALELVATREGATIEPRVITLALGKMSVPVTLRTTDAAPGEHGVRYDAFTTRDGERTKAGSLKFRWKVTETIVKVASWASPAAVANGDGEAAGTLVVDASPDLAGKTLRVAAAFGGLAAGMQVALDTKEVALTGGMQTIPVKMRIVGARTGNYQGTLTVALADKIEHVKALEPLAVKLDVVGATVHMSYEGGFQGLKASSERVVTIALTATGVPAPADLAITLDRGGLPADMIIEVPAKVTIRTKDGVTRVPVRLKTGEGPLVGDWQPKITVKALAAGIAVTPESVTIRASVPEAVTVVQVKETAVDRSATWIALGVALVVLFAVALFVLSRRKQVVHVHAASEPQAAPVPDFEDDELVLEEDDMFVIED